LIFLDNGIVGEESCPVSRRSARDLTLPQVGDAERESAGCRADSSTFLALQRLTIKIGMNLASVGRPMEKYLRVYTSIGGFVRIEPTTGNLCWEREDLEPVKKQCAKKYLAIEGFIEQAIGALDPEPDSEVIAMLDSIVFS